MSWQTVVDTTLAAITALAVSIPAVLDLSDRRQRKFPLVDPQAFAVPGQPNIIKVVLTIRNLGTSILFLLDLEILWTNEIGMCLNTQMQPKPGPDFEWGSENYDFEHYTYERKVSINQKLAPAGSNQKFEGRIDPRPIRGTSDQLETTIFLRFEPGSTQTSARFALTTKRSASAEQRTTKLFAIDFSND